MSTQLSCLLVELRNGEQRFVFNSIKDHTEVLANQVQRDYNGFGQLVDEYQSHDGAGNVMSTPVVQYGYSEMSGGANHSRLTSMTYPNGKVLNSNYASGLDADINRLSSLSNTTGTLGIKGSGHLFS